LGCPLCAIDGAGAVACNDTAIAVRDGFPVNPGHTLVIPRRHFADWFDATPGEIADILSMLRSQKAILDAEFRPDGYNIGINIGEAAGQTVMHLHIHLIPRYKGDVDDPRGGVRHVIPEKGNYKNPGRIPKMRKR
jgi:diadenosine tetraphosphate (Ap4A) HIT family hydrolase